MQKMTIFYGTDHVVMRPTLGLCGEAVYMATDERTAVKQACQKNAAGIIDTYRLDIDSLADDDLKMEDGFAILRTAKAVDSLTFIGASLTHRQGA